MKILENYPYVLTDPLFVGLMMEYFEKKSYRLKFDKRYDLMGMGAAKDFVLNACPMDISLMQKWATEKPMFSIRKILRLKRVNMWL